METPRGLRQRKPSDSSHQVDVIHVADDRDKKPRLNAGRDEVVWGKTPSGEGAWKH